MHNSHPITHYLSGIWILVISCITPLHFVRVAPQNISGYCERNITGLSGANTTHTCACAPLDAKTSRSCRETEDLCSFYNKSCVETCPGSHPFRSWKGFCLNRCPIDEPFQLNKTRWITCMQQCPESFYPENTHCIPCAEGCTSCYGRTSFECHSCQYAWYKNQCVMECPAHHVRFNDICLPVNQCRGNVFSEDCLSGICPPSFYPEKTNSSHRICRSCGDQCSKTKGCFGPGNHQCNACKHYTHNGTCVPQCPITTSYKYKQECFSQCPTALLNGTCVEACPKGSWALNHTCVLSCPPEVPIYGKGKCIPSCNKVLHKEEGLDHCPPGLYLDGKECVDSCPKHSPIIINGTICHHSCHNFILYRLNQPHCVQSCPLHLSIDNGTCTNVCPRERRYSDPKTLECKPQCPYFIIIGQCREKCPPPLVGFNHTCLPECPNNTVEHSGVCASQCPVNLMYNYSGNCVSSCPAEKPVFMNRICSKRCPSPLLEDTNKECVARCSNYYATFIYKSKCIGKCPLEAPVHFNHTCLRTCPQNLFQNSKNKCVKECTLPDKYIYKNTCTQACPPETPLSVNGTCETTCPSSWFLFDNNCVQKCPAFAPYTNGNSCTNCCPTYVTSQNCTDDCDLGMLQANITFGTCSMTQCEKTCPATHVKTHTSMCMTIKCSWEAPFIFNRICVKQCPPSYVFHVRNVCVSECPDGWHYSGNKMTTCVPKCPIGSMCHPPCPQSFNLSDGKTCVNKNGKCSGGKYRFQHLCLDVCHDSNEYNNRELVVINDRECGLTCSPPRPYLPTYDSHTCSEMCFQYFSWASLRNQALIIDIFDFHYEDYTAFYNSVGSNGTCVHPLYCPMSWGVDLVTGTCVEDCHTDAKWIPVKNQTQLRSQGTAFQCIPRYFTLTGVVTTVLFIASASGLFWFFYKLLRKKRRWDLSFHKIEEKLVAISTDQVKQQNKVLQTEHTPVHVGAQIQQFPSSSSLNPVEGNSGNACKHVRSSSVLTVGESGCSSSGNSLVAIDIDLDECDGARDLEREDYIRQRNIRMHAALVHVESDKPLEEVALEELPLPKYHL